MKISIKGTHIDLSPSVRGYVEDKFGGLAKFISAQEAKVELERDQRHQSGPVYRAELTLVVGGKIMRAEARGEDIYAAIDMVVPKIKEQISKFKDKKTTLRREGARKAKGKF